MDFILTLSKQIMDQAHLLFFQLWNLEERVEGEEISQESATIAYPCQPVFPQEWGCQQLSSPKILLDIATLLFPEIFQKTHTTGKNDFTSCCGAPKSELASLNKEFELTLNKNSIVGWKGTLSSWNCSKSHCSPSTNTWIEISTGNCDLKIFGSI